MADLSYGEDPQNFARALDQMKALADAKAELDAKDTQLRATEEQATSAIIDNTAALQRAINETRQLTTATQSLTEGVQAETNVLRTNTEAWAARVEVMRQAGTLGGSVGTGARGGAAARSSGAASAAETAATADAVRSEERPRERRPPRRPEQLAFDTSVAAETSGQLSLGGIANEGPRRRPSVAPREQLLLPPGRSTTPEAAGMADISQVATRNASALNENGAAAARMAENYERASTASAQLAANQERATVELNQSNAAFAEQSTSLSRNGALTTEFIQAFARGDVTLKEFTSQMTSTIGKFGGWAVAGGLVYGAYDAIKKLGEGAVQTQEGVQNLSRFIPAVSSGPARSQAEGAFRDISQQFNEPISEVTSSMTIMARTFHNVTDAANATRAVLYASRLDQISPEQSTTYLQGIAQSLNINTGSGLLGVVSSLNSLQNQLGARVNQTLPALARAAPAAEAGGLGRHQLEGLIAVGVRSGIPGNQVATGLLRSIGTFAFRPVSEATFRRYGVNAQRGDYGGLISQITQKITDPAKGKELSGQDINNLAIALGGTLQGPRVFDPLLEHANKIGEATYIAAHPTDPSEELKKILGGVGQEFDKLGIELENVGSELESSGILEPVQLLLEGFGLLGRGLEILVSPLEQVGNVLTQLPGPLKDLLGVVAGGAALRAARNSNFGFATQQGLGRLPGLHGLQDNSRQAVNDTASRLRTYILPDAQRDAESAQRAQSRAALESSRAQARVGVANDAVISSQGSPAAQEQLEQAQDEAVSADRKYAAAVAQTAESQEYVTTLKRQIGTLGSDELTYQQRLNYAYSQQLAVNDEITQALDSNLKTLVARDVAAAKTLPNVGTSARGRGGIIAGAAEDDTSAELSTLGASGLSGSSVESEIESEATPQELAAIIGATATAGDPQAIQNLLTTGPLQEAEQEGATGLPDLVLGGATPSSQAAEDFRNLPGAVGRGASGLGDRLGGLAGGTGAGLGLLIGSQVAGSAVGGGAGSAISGLGGAVGFGALGAGFVGGGIGRSIGGIGDYFTAGAEGEGAEAGELLGANPLVGAGVAAGLYGATKRGPVGLAASALGGAAAGFVIGGGPVGAGVGAAVGIGAHFFGTDVLGLGKKSSAQGSEASARAKQLGSVTNQISGNLSNLNAQVPFGQVFSAQLQSAFSDANQTDAQAAQSQVESTVRQLVQLEKDTGSSNRTGGSAETDIAQAVGAAAGSVGFSKDPYDVGQIVDTANQGLLGVNQTQFQYSLAQNTTNAGARRALGTSTADIARQRRQIDQGVSQNAGASLTNDRGLLASAEARRSRITAEPGAGDKPTTTTRAGGFGQAPIVTTNYTSAEKRLKAVNDNITSIEASITADKGRLSQASDITGKGSNLSISDIEQTQAQAAALLQQVAQNISDITSLASAQAGGNKIDQYNAQIKGAQQTLQSARTTPGQSPEARRSAVRQAQATVLSDQTQKTQQQGSELQARGQATAARFDTTIDPVGAAKATLAASQQYLDFVRSNTGPGKAFDPSDLNQALQNYRTANNAARDAAQQYNQTIAADLAGLSQAQNPASAAAQGGATVTQGRTDLGLARNRDQRIQAQTLIDSGNTAIKEAGQTRVQTEYQITESNQQGDPVAQALTSIAAARTALAQSLGPDQTIQAELQLSQANQALHAANQNQISAVGALQASTTNNTLKQDSDNLAAAQKKLAQAISGGYGSYTVTTDKTAVGQSALQKFNDNISQQINSISYLQSTLQISAQTALEKLQKLQTQKGLSVSQKQQISTSIYGIETDQDNTSLFDLAPAGSNIKAPTIYDVEHAAARERGAFGIEGARQGSANTVKIGGATVNTTGGSLNTHDVHVEQAIKTMQAELVAVFGKAGTSNGGTHHHYHGGDSRSAGNAMNRSMTTRIHSRQRAAGVRGT